MSRGLGDVYKRQVIVKATIIMQGQVITAVIIAIAMVTVQAITMAETELW